MNSTSFEPNSTAAPDSPYSFGGSVEPTVFDHVRASIVEFPAFALDTVSKIHSGLATFFTETSKPVQTGFEDWRSTTLGGIRNYVADRVVPARKRYTPERLEQVRTNAYTQLSLFEHSGITAREVAFVTSDGTILNGIELHGQTSEGAAQSSECILVFLGNGCLWETSLPKLKMIQELSKTTVICYNPRKVGLSTGQNLSETIIVSDGKEIAQSLLDQGRKPRLHGHSLGGGLAMQVGAGFAEKGIVLHLCIERSFTSIPEVVTAHSYLLSFIICPILYWTDWQLDSEAALLKLRGSRLVVIVHPKDPVIPYAAQFSRALDKWQGEGQHADASPLQLEWCDTLEMSEEQGDSDAHNRTWFLDEMNHYRKAVRNLLQ
jgi:hypothetical protein